MTGSVGFILFDLARRLIEGTGPDSRSAFEVWQHLWSQRTIRGASPGGKRVPRVTCACFRVDVTATAVAIAPATIAGAVIVPIVRSRTFGVVRPTLTASQEARRVPRQHLFRRDENPLSWTSTTPPARPGVGRLRGEYLELQSMETASATIVRSSDHPRSGRRYLSVGLARSAAMPGTGRISPPPPTSQLDVIELRSKVGGRRRCGSMPGRHCW